MDWSALASAIRHHVEVPDAPMEVAQFPHGSANLTYRITFGPQTLVVRRPPLGPIPPGAHDMAREHQVLARLGDAYDRAPRSLWFCDDESVIGAPFVVMEYRQGEVIWGTVPESMRHRADAPIRLGLAVIDALADLHAVNLHDVDLADLGRPDGFITRQLRGWLTRWERVADPALDEIARKIHRRLAATQPSSQPATLLHNDFKLDNCQFEPGEPDRVKTVFDWDMATVGDPLMDLGTLLNYWPDPSDTPTDRAITVDGLDAVGLPNRTELVERYAARTGRDLTAIGWYQAFATWRTAVVLQQLHHRYLQGDTSDPRMAERGAHTKMLLHRAHRLLEEAR